MSDPLQDLVNDLRKSQSPAQPQQRPAQQQQRLMQRPRFNGATVTKGEGGVRFDFGFWTGNPMADNATLLLSRHADPVQAQIANYQRDSVNKAINAHIRTGIAPEAQQQEGMHADWNEQFSKSLDQQVVESIKNGSMKVEGAISGASDPGQSIMGEFNKAQVRLGNEVVVGQSETDAAVIEMMKGMLESGGDELVSDATEGL